MTPTQLSSSLQVRPSEARQLWLLLLGMAAAVGLALSMGGDLYPLLTLFIAALGFAVAVGQLYIHSILGKVLVLGRTELYRGMAWSQLLLSGYGVALAGLGLSQEGFASKVPSLQWGSFWLWLSMWLLWWALPTVLWTLHGLLGGAVPKTVADKGLLWVGTPGVALDLAHAVFGRAAWVRSMAWLYVLCWWLFASVVALAGFPWHWTGLPPLWQTLLAHVLDAAKYWPLPWAQRPPLLQILLTMQWLAVTLTLAWAARRLGGHALAEVKALFGSGDSPESISGFALFSALYFIAIYLPWLQGTSAVMAQSAGWAGLMVLCLGMTAGLLMWVGGLARQGIRLWDVPGGVMAALGTHERESIQAALYWVVLVAVVSVWLFPALLAREASITYKPWWGFSFLFMVLGCNFMAATDLRNASAEAQALRSAAVNTRFISELAHELHNPLLPVRLYLEDESIMAFARAGESFDATDLAHSRSLALRGLKRAEDMLEQVKRNGVFPLITPKAQDLVSLLNEFAERYNQTLQHRGLAPMVSVFPADPTRQYVAEVDATVFQTVLRLLVDNAVDASKRGRENAVSFHLSRDQGQALLLDVQDRGRGLDPGLKDRFGHAQKSHKPGGTGLGTKLASDMARAMGGSLSVLRSDPNGTTVRWQMPAHQSGLVRPRARRP